MLFSELKIKDIVLSNRLVVAPMCQYSACNGQPTPWHYAHLSQFLFAGIGLLMLESTAVSSEGRITHNDLTLANETHASSLQKLLNFLKNINPVPIGLQLSHSGRKGSSHLPWIKTNAPLSQKEGGWNTYSPSSIPRAEGWPAPTELSIQQIHQIINDFAASTLLATQIGFDAIEIHMAHGYLLHQFFSPISNKRTDEYGGSLSERCKFLLDIGRKVRGLWPSSKILGARVTGCDWLKEGATVEDCIFLTNQLKSIGFDYVCISSGGILPVTNLTFKRGYQVHLSKKVKEETGILTRTAGLITSVKQAQNIITDGDADMIAIGRKFVQNPRWLYDYHPPSIPPQYQRCII